MKKYTGVFSVWCSRQCKVESQMQGRRLNQSHKVYHQCATLDRVCWLLLAVGGMVWCLEPLHLWCECKLAGCRLEQWSSWYL